MSCPVVSRQSDRLVGVVSRQSDRLVGFDGTDSDLGLNGPN